MEVKGNWVCKDHKIKHHTNIIEKSLSLVFYIPSLLKPHTSLVSQTTKMMSRHHISSESCCREDGFQRIKTSISVYYNNKKVLLQMDIQKLPSVNHGRKMYAFRTT